jgi:hypothetical protein
MTSRSRPLRIAVHLQLQHADYDAVRRAAAKAERTGVDIVFNYDHFYPLSGDPEGRNFEWFAPGRKLRYPQSSASMRAPSRSAAS